jgi:outer membrane protein OmpA-like peptidoglycan-associated protein
VLVGLLFTAGQTLADSDWNCDIREGESGEDDFTPCWYAGVGYGLSRFDPDENDASWRIRDNGDAGWLVYGGYHFKPDWFAELTYLDLGDVEAVDRNPNRNATGDISYKIPAVMVGYYFDLPELTDEFIPDWPVDTFVKAGVSAIQNSASPSTIPYEKQSSAQLALGVGLEWRFYKNWKVRNEYESFDLDAYSFNVSIAYIFGGKDTKPQSKKVQVVKPAQVIDAAPVKVPVPKIEPTVAMAPVITAAACEMFSGSLEGLTFKSGSDELTKASEKIVLKAVEALVTYESLEIEIQAHTDSVGRASFNEALSQKRATSVERFFIQNEIDAERLSSIGYGESKPIADNGTAEGRAKNRRVELKVVGGASCQ